MVTRVEPVIQGFSTHLESALKAFVPPAMILGVVSGRQSRTAVRCCTGKGRHAMSEPQRSFHARVLRKGDPPPCLVKRFQCRGCYGWENIIRAARSDPRWRSIPLHCHCTGLTLLLEEP